MKQIIIISAILIISTVAPLKAMPDNYETRIARAERFFKYKEWGSALAMYHMLLNERPNEVEPYYKAIVASAMIGDSITQMDLLEQTQQRGISLDSLFNGIRTVSFAIGEARAYNGFLQLVKYRQPWLQRKINMYLLDYYSFRNDTRHTIETAKILLTQTPNNTGYLKTLAEAYVKAGTFDKAIECYKQILAIKSDDYDALLALGNYYALQLLSPCPTPRNLGDKDLKSLSQTYLTEAYSIHPTPYVANLLAKIADK